MAAMSSPFFLLLLAACSLLQSNLALAMTNPTSTSVTTSSSGDDASSPSSSTYPQILPCQNPIIDRGDDDKGNTIISVTGRLNYVTPDTQQIDIHRHQDGTDSGLQGAKWQSVDVTIANGRLLQKDLDQHGYQLVDLQQYDFTKENWTPVPDFLDTNQVIDNFYPTCEQLVKQVLGSDEVEIVKAFDHNIRISISSSSRGEKELKGGGGSKAQVPIGMVHGDYTKSSGPKRLEDLAQTPKANDVLRERLLQAGQESSLLDPTMVQEALDGKRRFALINVWRNIDREHPVQELPLACADAQGIVMDDLKTLFIHYPDRIGQNYFVTHSPNHKWCYFPEMTHDEALLIKQWDSMGVIVADVVDGTTTTSSSSDHHVSNSKENNTSCFAIHSAFADPSSPPRARPRRSIEVRVAVIYKKPSNQ